MASIAGERYVAWGKQTLAATAVAGTKWEPLVEVDIQDNQNVLIPSPNGLLFEEKFRLGRFTAEGRISGVVEPENIWIYLGAWGLLGTPAIGAVQENTSYLHNWDEADFTNTPRYSTVEIEEDIKQRRYTGWVPNALTFNLPADDLLTYEIAGSALWVDHQTLDTSEAYSTAQPFSGMMGENTITATGVDTDLMNASVTFASPNGGWVETQNGTRKYAEYRHNGLEITGTMELAFIDADADDFVEEFWNGVAGTEPADDGEGGTAYDPFNLVFKYVQADLAGDTAIEYELEINLPTCVPNGPLGRRVSGTDMMSLTFPFRAIREDGTNLYDLKLTNKTADHFA